MQYDIAIVGGGMVGAAMACALQSLPLRVALIDATPLMSIKDHRLIALNANSIHFFENLHVWPNLLKHSTSIQSIHVSSKGHFGSAHLTAQEIGLNELGFVVPAEHIMPALSSRLQHAQNINQIRPAKLIAIEEANSTAKLTISREGKIETLQANTVIAADGTHSTVRELIGIAVDTFDYKQKALVTVTELQRAHHHIAYERFLATGAIAMLPLQGNFAATIWSDDATVIDELLAMPAEEFRLKLQNQFGYRLGKFIRIQERFCYPLQYLNAKQQIKQRVILLGNAAHTLHPIAAQGLNLAIYEIACLAEHFTQSTQTPTHLPYLPTQTNSMQLSHQLTQLFSNDFFLLNTARQCGLIGLDITKFLKKKFMLHAMSMHQPLPKLLQENGASG